MNQSSSQSDTSAQPSTSSEYEGSGFGSIFSSMGRAIKSAGSYTVERMGSMAGYVSEKAVEAYTYVEKNKETIVNTVGMFVPAVPMVAMALGLVDIPSTQDVSEYDGGGGMELEYG
jgi:hypothetical protein